ncbi:hypothetical protein AVEN_263845-1 [Araneus ventricosus]|uniref:Uncharacterized protein n=1 Tax=Araneus ventricosus TaxID=182803 RepID=A0A4Y2E0Y6_ARAVE|nr:hypothetical protein AVEN_263845-1 [Araneus ventricosus]
MLGSTSYTIRNTFYPHSSNINDHLLTHNAINQKNCNTVNLLEKIEQEMDIKSIPFTDIPAKSSDVSSMGIWAFGLLYTQYSNIDLQPFVDIGKMFKRNGQNTSPDTTTGTIFMEVTMQ